MPTPLDIGFAILVAVVLALLNAFYLDPRFKRQVARGVPAARRTAYQRSVAAQWIVAATAIALWAREGRAWRVLGLAPPAGWRLVAGLALAAAVAAFVVRQNAAVRRRSGDQLDQLRTKLGAMEFMLPRTVAEYRWFIALSLTAGVCEELLYRGFLTWLVASYVPLAAAIVVVSAAFGLQHAYQGRSGIFKTGIVALAMSGIVVLSGWLIPAMVVHALIDVSGGVLGFNVLSRTVRQSGQDPVPGPT